MTPPATPVPTALSRWERFRKAPLMLLFAMVAALYVIGDEYPFSNYPMYSNFDEEALVFFISDREGNPLAMRDVFDKSASDAKKIYKNHLSRFCKDAGIDTNQASLELRKMAGRKVLDQLLQEHRRPDFAEQTAGLEALQAQLRRVRLEDSEFHDDFTLLAEVPLK